MVGVVAIDGKIRARHFHYTVFVIVLIIIVYAYSQHHIAALKLIHPLPDGFFI